MIPRETFKQIHQICPNGLRGNRVSCLQVVLCFALILLGGGSAALALESPQEYTVQSGDTLSQIAKRNQLPAWFLQRLNGVRDINLLSVGQKLLIPSVRWMAEPFLKPDERPFEEVEFGKLNKTNLIVGIGVRGTNDFRRFFVVKLQGTNRTLMLDPEKFTFDDGEENFPGNYFAWQFKDFDGDGDSDLLGEHTQGAYVFLTMYGLHFDGKEYKKHLLVEEIPTGFTEFSKTKTGSMVIKVYARTTGQLTVVDWRKIRESNSQPTAKKQTESQR